MAILAGITPSESVKVRHSPLASENLTYSVSQKKVAPLNFLLYFLS